jgi:hypothetical protein
MLNGIRVALISVAISVAAVSARQAPPNPYFIALENDYVRVAVWPPDPRPPATVIECLQGTGPDGQLVKLYVPSRRTDSAPQAPKTPSDDPPPAAYFGPNHYWACQGVPGGTLIYVALKAMPGRSSFSDDAVKSDAANNEILLENDVVRVVRIHFAPGESGPIVDKRPRVIIAVTDSHATVTLSDGHTEPREAKAGSVSFGDAGRQATANTGATPLENIVVELKAKGRQKK